MNATNPSSENPPLLMGVHDFDTGRCQGHEKMYHRLLLFDIGIPGILMYHVCGVKHGYIVV